MFVYLISNTKNGKLYVGTTTYSLETRWKQHVKQSKHPDSGRCDTRIQKAIRKYGKENFCIGLLLAATSVAEMNVFETHFIKLFHTNERKRGYNGNLGGSGTNGTQHTSESIAKMRLRKLGKKLSPETKLKIAAYQKGRKKSPESIAKMSASKKGHSVSDETRKKLSDYNKANPNSGVFKKGYDERRNK